ncbi:hypothetical protein ACVIKO_002574 [Rhizobium ruizarguesonis]
MNIAIGLLRDDHRFGFMEYWMKRSALDGSQHTNFIYLLPGLLFYAAFVFGPILAALGLSLTSWDGLTMPKWVGLGNYADLFSDSRFYIALRNNAELMIFYCVLPLVLGIALAACVWNLKQREQLALRTFLFLPYIMPTAVLGIIWAVALQSCIRPVQSVSQSSRVRRLRTPVAGRFQFCPSRRRDRCHLVFLWFLYGHLPHRNPAHRPVSFRRCQGRWCFGAKNLFLDNAAASVA